MIYCFTGDGKGKTSAALGIVVRSLLIDKKVLWVSWYKSNTWDISEKKLVEKFPDNLTMVWAGKGFFLKDKKSVVVNNSTIHDFDTPQGHRKSAEDALGIIKSTGGGYDLIVMDEILNAVDDGLIREEELGVTLNFLNKSHVVLTGRGVTAEMIKICDLVTEVKKIKHPFDKGLLAVKGLDF